MGHFPEAVPAATSTPATALREDPAGASMIRLPGPTTATIAITAITRAPTAGWRRAPNTTCPPALITITRGPGDLLTIPLRAGIPRLT
mmetsp:Transcript_845/g.1067  ORF Transcript_845/g.1067 Transcript_845/m.1067 type:complete len:88 (-) Transcript_845:3-266(-)